MHHFEGKRTSINYNSDLSGDISILVHSTEDHDSSNGKVFWVLGEDILDFVAEYVANQKIAKLEQMTSNEIFGIE